MVWTPSVSVSVSLLQKIEELLGLELAEDIGEWVADGVVLCKLVKKLHPQLMSSFHAPSQGKVRYHHPLSFPWSAASFPQELSRGRKTVNIANFIAACRQLHMPEEEVRLTSVSADQPFPSLPPSLSSSVQPVTSLNSRTQSEWSHASRECWSQLISL